MVNFELRLKTLRKSWISIQGKLNKLDKMKIKLAEHKTQARSLAQKIPLLQKEANEELKRFSKCW